MIQRIAFGILCGLAFGIISASAQDSAKDKPVRVAGTVESFDGQTLAVKSAKLGEVKINLTADATVFGVAKATLADVKAGSYVGIGAMPQPDGSQRAVQVTVMAESQRGLSEGHRPWDARPNSTMTNAYVTSMVKEKDGEILTVKYKDGEKKVVVTPQTVIAAAAPAKKEEIKAGTQMIIFGWDKQPDGSVLAKTLYVGRSVTPAM